jgi:hypothetical protein
MNRKSLLGVIGACVLLAVIALRTQGNARRTIEQESAYVSINETTVDFG